MAYSVSPGCPCAKAQARTWCDTALCFFAHAVCLFAEAAAKKADLAARKEERRKAMAELQARKRMLGNIVFVGQLFK